LFFTLFLNKKYTLFVLFFKSIFLIFFCFAPFSTEISKEILDNLNTTQVYLCSDMVLRFNSSNHLVGRFNYSSNIALASDHTISSIGDLNISA